MPIVPLSFAPSHPAFAGHFPSRPIVPGVLLLDWTLCAIESHSGVTLGGIAAAKFLSPAGPGDELELEYKRTESAAYFEIRCGERKIASGRFLIADDCLA